MIFWGTNNEDYGEEETEYPSKEVVLEFIANFRGDNLDDENKVEIVRHCLHKYMNGYCYYFAKILQSAFRCGDVVLMAPHGHFAWRAPDGATYDIWGERDESANCEVEVEIEEEYLGEHLINFLWVPGEKVETTKEDVDRLIKEALERNRSKNEKVG